MTIDIHQQVQSGRFEMWRRHSRLPRLQSASRRRAKLAPLALGTLGDPAGPLLDLPLQH